MTLPPPSGESGNMPTDKERADLITLCRRLYPRASRDDIEEAAQSALIAFWRNAPEAAADDPRKRKAWLRKVAARALSAAARQKRSVPLAAMTKEDLMLYMLSGEQQGSEYDFILQWDEFRRYHRRLKDPYRQAIWFLMADMVDELCALTGVQKNTMEQRISRAIKMLRQMREEDARSDARKGNPVEP